MEYLIGLILALAVCLFMTLAGFDRDRALYPAMAIMVASYYALFAAINSPPEIMAQESAGIAAFILLATLGFRSSLWFAVGALAAHGIFDGLHAQFIANPGVPQWWPGFCMTFDVAAACWLAGRLLSTRVPARPARSRQPEPGFALRIRPHVDAELAAARSSMVNGKLTDAFRSLERAHVLSQHSTREHVRVHWHMLHWALAQKRPGEIAGQVLRIMGAALLTGIGLVPAGDTGGGNVSSVKRMPLPEDLRRIIAAARARPLP